MPPFTVRPDMSDASPLTRARENPVGLVSILVTGAWMLGLFTGQDWWLVTLIVGYAVVVPLVAVLFGDEEAAETYTPGNVTSTETDETTETHSEPTTESTADALDTLRDRYARGELTEEQFERKLDRLLETETVENAEAYRDRARDVTDDTDGDTGRPSTDREPQRERE
jgi:uncharacterized membrane protein